ncbi:MAG: DUF983 domain-containing protein [Actinomycetota bacterium]
MGPQRHPSPLVVLARGSFRRCPRCGSKGVFESWFRLKPGCVQCHLDFEREPGWWIGGMIVNTAMSMAVLLLVAGSGLVASWPDVPWTGLTILCIATMAVFPIWFYPMSKTVWLGIDLLMADMDPAPRQ